MNPCRAIAQGRAATLAAWGRGGGVGENIATCRWARAMGSAAPERYDWLWRRQRQRQARCGGPGRARSVRTRRAGRRRSGGRAGRAGGPGRGRDGTVTGVPLWWIGGWAKYLTHVEWSRITGDGGWGGGGRRGGSRGSVSTAREQTLLDRDDLSWTPLFWLAAMSVEEDIPTDIYGGAQQADAARSMKSNSNRKSN